MISEKYNSKENQMEDAEGNIRNQKPSGEKVYADPGWQKRKVRAEIRSLLCMLEGFENKGVRRVGEETHSDCLKKGETES